MTARITASTLANARGVSIDNVATEIVATNKPMKGLLIGAALAANTSGGTYTLLTRTRVRSADQVGSLAGFGSRLHRDAIAFFTGSDNAVEVNVIIQAELASPAAVAAAGSFAVTHAATASGYLYLYIDGTRYAISVTSAMSVTQIGDAIVEALAADPACAVVGVNTTGTVALTSKSKGTVGNDINISLNQRAGELSPTGFTSTITPMTSGANDPAIAAALAILGSGDNANYYADTHVIVSYGRLSATVLDALSTYNGTANEIEGCYLDTVGRPFVSFQGDTDPGTDGMDALTTITNGRKETDKTNFVIARPNSPTSPYYLAAYAAGALCALAHSSPQSPSGGIIMNGVEPGPLAVLAAATGDWCAELTNRTEAVAAGLGTTISTNGVVELKDVVSCYHPTTISAYSNCYRLHNNTWKVANMSYNTRNLLESDYFKQITIVDDISKVGSQTARSKCMDRDLLFGYLVQLVGEFEKAAWIWSAASTLNIMKDDLDTYIVLREGGLGHDVIIPSYLSGSLEIMNTKIRVDANSASAQ